LFIFFFSISGALIVHSQMMDFPLEAMDELSEMGTGPSPDASLRDRTGENLTGEGERPDTGTEDYNLPGAEKTVPLVKVLTGRRVYDAITGDLLEDVFYEDLPKDMVMTNPEYKDDGTPPDVKADDLIWTHKDAGKVVRNVIGPDNHIQRRYLFKMIEITSKMDPLEFFGLYISTEDEFSKIYQDRKENELSFQEIDQVRKILEWMTDRTSIKRYRKTDEGLYSAEDPTAPLLSLWVPYPPRMPGFNLPEGFNPILKTLGEKRGPDEKEASAEDDYNPEYIINSLLNFK